MSEHKSSEREVPRSSITKDDPSMATQGRESHQASNGTASQPTSATSDLGSDDQLPEPPFGDYHGSIENEENGLGTKADVTGLQKFTLSSEYELRPMKMMGE